MSRIIGIDLGTTNSLVAVVDPDGPRILAGPDGDPLLPSLVHVAPDGAVTVGAQARHALTHDPQNTIYSVKRLMGRSFEDVEAEQSLYPYRLAGAGAGVVRILAGGREWTPPEVSALILQALKRRAEAALSEEVTQAVITVPAYFNDAQRQATKDAGRIAGLEVLRLVNEPTAASLAYGLNERRDAHVAVYDFGGGTFDISLLRLSNGIFEVKATAGDTHLGGDDLDRVLAALFFHEIEEGHGARLQDTAEGLEAARLAAEQAKRALTTADETTVDLPLYGGDRYTRVLTRAEFEERALPVVERTLEPCRQALRDARLDVFQIDDVVMVGGSTRVPLVRNRVRATFQRTPHTALNPDEVVALGAAVQADILAGGSRDLLLLDVTPLSLGIETMGGAVEKIIPRNTTIPTVATDEFSTGVDNQTAVDLHIVQGEREMAQDCRSLARFQLRGIPPLPAGVPLVAVTFMLDANGILQVHAMEKRTGQEAAVQVKPSYGLTEEEVDRLVAEAYDHAEEDVEARLLAEARVEAQTLVTQTRKQMDQWRHLLGDIAHRILTDAANAAEVAANGDDIHLIRDRTDRLNYMTQPFAEAILNETLREALQGKTVEQAEHIRLSDTSEAGNG